MSSEHLFTSTDGVQISYRQSGSGPPVVLVHATSADRHTFRFVGPILEQQFTIIAVDRRGRGDSGDSSGAYRIEQEFQDIAGIVDALPEPANLFGHSYGATVALGAARISRNVRRLILYEPTPGIAVATEELLVKMDSLLDLDKRDDLLSTVMTDFAGFKPAELAQFQASPIWKPRVAAAHTIPREVRAEQHYRPDPSVFAGFSIPTLLLLGSESPSWARRGTEVVRSLLHHSEIRMLAGQGHVATMTAPGLLADEIVQFLTRE
jgi:pimeloyl-ACP methyl ester carboxylesterase